MRPRKAIAATLLAVAASAASAETVMSLNHVVTNQMPFEQCMQRAAALILNVGFRSIGATSEAQWGKSYDNQYTAVVYCLRMRDVAVLAASGPNTQGTTNVVQRLQELWSNMQ